MAITPVNSNLPVANTNQANAATPAANAGQPVALGSTAADAYQSGGTAGLMQSMTEAGVPDDNKLLGSYGAPMGTFTSNLSTMSQEQAQVEFASVLQNGPTTDYQDVNALVQQVLREAYGQNTEDLRHYAGKVKHFNKQKEMVREFLSELREVSTASREVALQGGKTGDDLENATLSSAGSFYGADSADAETASMLGMPMSLNALPEGKEVNTVAKLDDYIKTWEDKLNSIGDDAQLANVDLQNMLQKQQQTLQMLSNISKALHDTAMAIIRKMGG